MKDKKRTKYLIRLLLYVGLGIIIGSVLGVLMALFDIEIHMSGLVLGWIALVVIAILFSIIKLANPIRYIAKGQIDIAIEKYRQQIEKYHQNIRLCLINYYNLALCFNLKGDFNESIGYLERIDASKIDKNVKSAYYLLYASNLVLLEGNIRQAEEYYSKAKQIRNIPGMKAVESCIEAYKGDFIKANQLISDYKTEKNKSYFTPGFFTIMFADKKLEDITNGFMIGLACIKMNDIEKAKQCFLKVSQYELDLYYVKRARELLNN